MGLFQDVSSSSESTDITLSIHSRAMFKAAIVLSQRYNITTDKQFIGWQTAQTDGDAIDALTSTCRSISTSNIVGIVGPSLSREAHTIALFAKRVGIPVISYSATDPSLSDRNVYPTFYRTVSSDNATALAIVKLFARFNWTSCVIIYQNDDFGINGADTITNAFYKSNLIVVQALLFDISRLTIRGDLKRILSRSSTRIVLLWAESTYTTSILQYALDNDILGPQFLWILSSSISLNSFNPTFYQKLIGILTVEPIVGNAVDASVNTTLLNSAYDIWHQYEPETFPGSTRVNSYALFAFDATWSLILSLQQCCSSVTNTSSAYLSWANCSFCFDCRFLNSNSFLNTITTTQFLGVSGAIRYSANVTDRIDGNYFIVQNVQPASNGVDYMPVLRWTDSSDWKTYAQTNIIVWPGNSLVPPSGFPTLSGVNLRIGVLISPPFLMTTNVISASGQNTTTLSGYIPDLIDRLTSATGFIPEIMLAPSDQTYDGIVQAVVNGDYDIVIGDVSVTAARRQIVDFSISIFDNTFSVIVRKTISVQLDFFAYLKPFSLNLWLTLLAACIYAAVLFWILERQVNEALKDKSIISSVAMSIWYSLGTILGCGVEFAMQTAAGRLLTLGLYILSIILVATYTANLAADLTILKSQNIISGIDDIKNGKLPLRRVGILVNSSFEYYFLKEVSFENSGFYPLKTTNEIYTSLINNNIDASIMDTALLEYAIDTLYCSLTLAGTPFNPNAYAVVIPKGWLFTQALDVSILSLRESGTINDLQQKWFDKKICSDSSASDTSSGMNVVSVGGLFATFAVITVLSLLLFAWTKRLIIKDHIWKLLYRKNSLTQQNGVVEISAIQTHNDSSQNSRSEPLASSQV